MNNRELKKAELLTIIKKQAKQIDELLKFINKFRRKLKYIQ
tara:strand:- start:242 stop:364 length:123 start_codon:yes stop_codon:yes gene_type:complete